MNDDMRTVKQILVSVLSILLFFNSAIAEKLQQPAPVNPVVPGDTTIFTKDSLGESPITVNNPKIGFKNLFETAVIGDGVNPAKLNPMAVSFVQDYITKNGKGFRSMKEWAKPYFDMMDAVLAQHGLPKELKYLAVIESGLRYNAISWAGAVGPWALMPATANQYGLRISRHNDERLDYYKSTHAAAALLTDLFAQYGDWLLVIAAYNGGPGNVNKAIKKSGGSKDFWTLQYYLPNESMNHVKKFIATHYIMEGEGGITTVTRNEMKDMLTNGNINLSKDEINSSKVQPVTGRYNSSVIVKHIEMDIATFYRYNPGFDNQVATNGSYDLRLPADKMDIFLTKKPEILNESLQLLLNPSGNSGGR
ncbi:MAG TPA: lytic transglycosylase domain-containing protein [Chitinophagaceae bacterium]|nr:lytic transglycosylase domain-containing protein [Chitinophagaceae bacterium]